MSWAQVKRDSLGRVINRVYVRKPRVTPISKKCSSCHQVKLAADFNRDRQNASGLTSRCSACTRENSRLVRPRRQEKYRTWLASLKSIPCMDCGDAFPAVCMDFDHVRGKKEFHVNTGRCSGYAVSRILKEIEKCDVVCANCHRIRTSKRARGHGRR